MTKVLDDNEILKRLGIKTLDEEGRNRVLGHFYQNLQVRVVGRLEKQLSDQQLEAFNKTAKDFDSAEQWLQGNLPDYRQVIMEEADQLLNDIQGDTKLMIEKTDKPRQ